ncbi:hypothetical protein D3C74_243320 [compost metagenome]
MYKNKLYSTLFVSLLVGSLIIVLFTKGCSQNRMDFYENTFSTDLSKENVGTISIGSNKSDIISKFGEPNSIKESQVPDTFYLRYGEDDNLTFKLVDGVVREYFFSDKELKTEKNISIGSTKEEVIKQYGENYYLRTDTGEKNNVLGYFDKEKNIVLEFIFDKDVIVIFSTYNSSVN